MFASIRKCLVISIYEIFASLALITLFASTDNERPIINGMPTNIIQGIDSGLATAIISWTEPTTTDNSGSQTLTSTHTPGSSFNIGVTSVEYRAVDFAGNEAVDSFTVTIEGMSLSVIHTDEGLRNEFITQTVQDARDQEMLYS